MSTLKTLEHLHIRYNTDSQVEIIKALERDYNLMERSCQFALDRHAVAEDKREKLEEELTEAKDICDANDLSIKYSERQIAELKENLEIQTNMAFNLNEIRREQFNQIAELKEERRVLNEDLIEFGDCKAWNTTLQTEIAALKEQSKIDAEFIEGWADGCKTAEAELAKLKELLKNMGLCLEDHLETIKEAVKE